jgi:urease accessory protein
MTTDPSLLALLQLADGVFPSGGFAHSLGLETYVQEGRVRDAEGVLAFLTAHLEGSAGPTDAVAVAAAVRCAHAGDLAGLQELDERIDAMRWVPEHRAASRQMGRQTLRATASWSAPVLEALARAVDEGLAPGHHALAFGAAAGCGGASPTAAAAAFLHSTAAMLVGAALRLLPLGQLEGQRLLTVQRTRLARLATVAAETAPDDMWSFSPGLELASLRHAALDARLFRS